MAKKDRRLFSSFEQKYTKWAWEARRRNRYYQEDHKEFAEWVKDLSPVVYGMHHFGKIPPKEGMERKVRNGQVEQNRNLLVEKTSGQ